MLEIGTRIKLIKDAIGEDEYGDEKLLYKEGSLGTIRKLDMQDCDGLCYGVRIDNTTGPYGWFKKDEIIREGETVNMPNELTYLMKATVTDNESTFDLNVPLCIETNDFDVLVQETKRKILEDRPNAKITNIRLRNNFTGQNFTVGSREIDKSKFINPVDAEIKELTEKMKNLSGDPDTDHVIADGILVDVLKLLGYEELVDAYKKVEKWYA